MKRTIRTTMRPHEEIEVDEAEFLDLSRQGLIHEEVHPGSPESTPTGLPDGEHRDSPEQVAAVREPTADKARNRRGVTPGEASPPRNQKEI